MEQIAGMPTTPRRVQGPGFELVGVSSDQGTATALWIPKGSACEAEGVTVPESARAFLVRPAITGLARLIAMDRDQRALVYATGESWSAAEVSASLRRKGQRPGVRAGVELAWRVTDLLVRTRQEAATFGLTGHGSIDPWRVALRADGQVVLLGYGVRLGHPERTCTGAERAEALRYAPPERIADASQDITSDLFSLTLLALEWMLGEPVYSGDPDAIRRQAIDAEGDHRLYAWRDRLPAELAEVVGKAIRRDTDARWTDPAAYSDALRRQLSNPALDGAGLFQLMSAAQLETPRRFVGLGEVRGDADQRSAPREAPAPAAEGKSRYVSLGGRTGGKARPLETTPVTGPRPARAEAPEPGRRPTAPQPAETTPQPTRTVPEAPAPEAPAPTQPETIALPPAPQPEPPPALADRPAPAVSAAPATRWQEEPAPIDWDHRDARRVAAHTAASLPEVSETVEAATVATPRREPPAAAQPQVPQTPDPAPQAAPLPPPQAPAPPPPREVTAPTIPVEKAAPPPPRVAPEATAEVPVIQVQVWEDEPAAVTAEAVPAPALPQLPPEPPATPAPTPDATPTPGWSKAETPDTARHASTWQHEEEPTRTISRSRDPVPVTFRDPEGRRFQVTLDPGIAAADAIDVVAKQRGLPRNDLLGATVYGWRIARNGAVIADAARFVAGERDVLDLVRIPNRPVLVGVLVRDPAGDAWLSAAVGTAVPAARVVAWLVTVFALEPGDWILKVNGFALHPDGLLDGLIEDGGELELTR